MQRTPMKRKTKKRDNEFTPTVRKAVEARSGGKCEAQTPACSGPATHHHHRLMRSQGGQGTESNDLHCCGPCHTYIHRHATESYERGWLIRGLARSA